MKSGVDEDPSSAQEQIIVQEQLPIVPKKRGRPPKQVVIPDEPEIAPVRASKRM